MIYKFVSLTLLSLYITLPLMVKGSYAKVIWAHILLRVFAFITSRENASFTHQSPRKTRLGVVVEASALNKAGGRFWQNAANVFEELGLVPL